MKSELQPWYVLFHSGDAVGEVIVSATSTGAAKNSAFNQFLGLEKSNIIWRGEPTFWVVCQYVKLAAFEADLDTDLARKYEA